MYINIYIYTCLTISPLQSTVDQVVFGDDSSCGGNVVGFMLCPSPILQHNSTHSEHLRPCVKLGLLHYHIYIGVHTIYIYIYIYIYTYLYLYIYIYITIILDFRPPTCGISHPVPFRELHADPQRSGSASWKGPSGATMFIAGACRPGRREVLHC